MNKTMQLYNLIDMLKTLDLEKNSKEDIKAALEFIADKLEEYIDEQVS